MHMVVFKRSVCAACVAWVAMMSVGAAHAQSPPASGASTPSAPTQALPIHMGTGAGEHGANSPFAPLQPRRSPH